MIRKTIALCLCLGVLACSKGSESAQDIGALVRIEEAEDTRQWDAAAMEALLAHEDASIRARAALAAGRIGDPATIHRLADLINKDADWSVGGRARFAVGRCAS